MQIRVKRHGTCLMGVMVLTLLASCSSVRHAEVDWSSKDIGTFEYHPLVSHLDLCILAYQLYAQTVVWPFDPYYEAMGDDRENYMQRVRAWAEEKGRAQAHAPAVFGGYRGPGVLGGFADNPWHDPLLFRYGDIEPSQRSVTTATGASWLVLETPSKIYRRIGSIAMCYRSTGGPPGSTVLEWVRREGRSGARDILLAFEGGTGNKGVDRQPESQSLMGYVLVRMKPERGYDVHVVFRGSRSGDTVRAGLSAFSDDEAEGNPDWITDLGADRLGADQGGTHISVIGEVHRGFAYSMKSILPQLLRCLEEVAMLRPGVAPDHVYVTGHSLGGALGQHFVSAILLGDRLGPNAAGPDMPPVLSDWPWNQVKLITYGAPRAGDKEWARELTGRLHSDFFATMVYPLDEDALAPADEIIVKRLLDEERPTAYRVLITSDPITSEKIFGGKHVGKSVYANKPAAMDYLPRPDFDAHKPALIREFLTATVRDPRTPQEDLWREETIEGLDSSQPGKNPEDLVRQLAEAYKRFRLEQGLSLNEVRFAQDLKLRFAIGVREPAP